MKSNKIYFALFISFLLLLSTLLISYSSLQKNTKMLKYLDRDQIKLSFYANSLNHTMKRDQTYTLNQLLLKNSKLNTEVKYHYKEIENYISKLSRFVQKHPKLSKDFSKKLISIQQKVASSKIIQTSLFKAVENNNLLTFKSKLLEYNTLIENFSQEIISLIELGNAHQYQKIYLLQEENQTLSYILIFSFIIAILLIFMSIIQFNRLNSKIKLQLFRAENAEKDLKHAQKQLLKYNDDLEHIIVKKTEEIHEKIYTNFLSGLPNRNKLLDDNTQHTIKRIAILNIDKFQSFNDIYGEEIGNVALKMSAEFLKKHLQDMQLTLYHIGGDEFVISSEASKLDDAEFINLINDILLAFKTEKFFYEQKTFQFMMSAGIAYGKKKKLLAYADMALKDAKKRNIQLAIYDENNKLEKIHKDDLECRNKLKKAIDGDGVISYYQPITPIQTNTLPQKYESLVRINDDGTIIPPFRFIDVAKVNRIYYKLTRRVIQNTLETISKYKIHCSLNFSLSDIENKRTMKHFFEIIENYDYNELLTIELLETEDFNNYDSVYEFCMKVRTYGIKIALDDFGSGYSNFSHILHLPIDYIKIDASLISNIDRNYNSRIMVETIVELAKKIHITTIAEFVSSKEILDVIKELGVDYAQGYYLGKPAPIEEHLKSGGGRTVRFIKPLPLSPHHS